MQSHPEQIVLPIKSSENETKTLTLEIDVCWTWFSASVLLQQTKENHVQDIVITNILSIINSVKKSRDARVCSETHQEIINPLKSWGDANLKRNDGRTRQIEKLSDERWTEDEKTRRLKISQMNFGMAEPTTGEMRWRLSERWDLQSAIPNGNRRFKRIPKIKLLHPMAAPQPA